LRLRSCVALVGQRSSWAEAGAHPGHSGVWPTVDGLNSINRRETPNAPPHAWSSRPPPVMVRHRVDGKSLSPALCSALPAARTAWVATLRQIPGLGASISSRRAGPVREGSLLSGEDCGQRAALRLGFWGCRRTCPAQGRTLRGCATSPDFPDTVVPGGMIRAGCPYNPRVFGHFDRGI